MIRFLQELTESVMETILFVALGAFLVGLLLIPALIAATILKYLLQ